MRKKRNISTEVIRSNAVRGLPATAAWAYVNLCLYADDDGFVDAPLDTVHAANVPVAELETLRAAGLVLLFDNCALIRHWYKHEPKTNWRYRPTAHTAELALMELDENGNWTFKDGCVPERVAAAAAEAPQPCTEAGKHMPNACQEVTNALPKTCQRESKPVSAAAPTAGAQPVPDPVGETAGSALPKTCQEDTTHIAKDLPNPCQGVTTQVAKEEAKPCQGEGNCAPSRAYIDNNNNNNKNNFSYRYSDHSESGFKPPTVEEVRAYCQGEDLTGVDAPYFVDYYAAKGWRVGSSPMADWRAVARNWQLKSKERKRDAPPEKPPLRPLYKVFTKEDFL